MKNKILTLDYHGVVNKNPDFFYKMTTAWQESGGVVFLLSGLNLKDLVEISNKINHDFGVRFNQCISVETRLISDDVPYTKMENGNLWFPDYEWDSAKGKICEELGSNLHFDDSPEYQLYFKTPFVLWN